MAKLPYFPFYPSDWISSPRIMCLSLAEQGAYIRLLAYCWLSGDCSLPSDPKKLSILSGLPEQELNFVHQLFVIHPSKNGCLTNKRLMEEWVKADRISGSRSQAGKKSGKSRRTLVQQVFQQNANKARTNTPISESESYSESEVRSHTQNQIQKKKERSCDLASPIAPVWRRYAEAYRIRYGAEPVSNAKTNGQFAQLIKRVGIEAAPELAAYYVSHNDPFYVRMRHPPGILLQQAEGLHTQWKTGVKATTQEAKNAEFRDNVVGQADRVVELLRKETRA